MTVIQGRVVSAFLGASGTLRKEGQASIDFAIDGIVGDRHRGPTRRCWEQTDKQPGGTEPAMSGSGLRSLRKILMWFPRS